MSVAERLLQRWRDAGLLDDETAARIRAFEQEHAGPARPYLFYALGGLGALSIGIGLISIVAANWDEISPTFKLTAALVLLAGLALGTEATARRAARSQGGLSVSAWGVDVLVFLYYGATLACISLVAQIYQMGGKAQHALAFWSLVTVPLLLQGRGRLLMAVWLWALQGTVLFNVFLWSDQEMSGRREVVVNCSAMMASSLVIMALGSLSRLRRSRPQLASVAQGLGLAQWLILASLAQQLWYERGSRYDSARDYAAVGAMVSMVLAVLVLVVRRLSGARGAAFAVVLLLGTLSCYLPLLVPHDDGTARLVGALSFLALWVLVGWHGLRSGSLGLFNLATAIIAVRLLIVYFEVFESMLRTGLGLVSGGLLTLLMAWIWLRKVRRSTTPTPATPAVAAAGGQP